MPKEQPHGNTITFTPEQRERVRAWAAAGVKHQDIGNLLGISQPTLRKHFRKELQATASERLALQIARLQEMSEKGNVAAMKALVGIFQKHVTTEAMQSYGDAPAAQQAEPKPVKRGKKEQAHADAQTAGTGTEWQDLLPPVLPN